MLAGLAGVEAVLRVGLALANLCSDAGGVGRVQYQGDFGDILALGDGIDVASGVGARSEQLFAFAEAHPSVGKFARGGLFVAVFAMVDGEVEGDDAVAAELRDANPGVIAALSVGGAVPEIFVAGLGVLGSGHGSVDEEVQGNYAVAAQFGDAGPGVIAALGVGDVMPDVFAAGIDSLFRRNRLEHREVQRVFGGAVVAFGHRGAVGSCRAFIEVFVDVAVAIADARFKGDVAGRVGAVKRVAGVEDDRDVVDVGGTAGQFEVEEMARLGDTPGDRRGVVGSRLHS